MKGRITYKYTSMCFYRKGTRFYTLKQPATLRPCSALVRGQDKKAKMQNILREFSFYDFIYVNKSIHCICAYSLNLADNFWPL